jgi:iron(II)-dependent oxidoreductase
MRTSEQALSTPHVEVVRTGLEQARAQSDSLFQLLAPGAVYERPIPERHRLIFYFGHFEAFDWNVLARRGMSAPTFHPEFDQLFERGIDPPPGQARQDSAADWPSRNEVAHYGEKTRDWIDSHLDELDPWLLQMVIEHRHMHAETFSYLLHGLPYDQKLGVTEAYTARDREQSPARGNPTVAIHGRSVTLGKSKDTFGWDNEHLSNDVSVPDFRISKFKISNGEYLEFVRAGGQAPHFWSMENNRWVYRGMFSQFPLPLDWPVWVTWQQASAYARWRGLELPTEAQYQLAAQLTTPDRMRDNFDYARWDPIAVDAGASESNAPAQMTGNGWEWTRDAFAPFPGFEPDPAYRGFFRQRALRNEGCISAYVAPAHAPELP